MKRRNFLKGTLGLLGSLTAMGFYTWQIEPFWLEFVYLKMNIDKLPQKLQGKKLMQISDVHVGPVVSTSFLLKSFEKAAKIDVDFVVYTGDFIHYENEKTFDTLQEVMAKAPKGKLKTIAILGNHDYGEEWVDPSIANRISSILQKAGITVLRNESIQSHGLNFIGIDDYWGTNFFPKKAMQSFNPAQPNIVLCHNPDVCDLNVWNGYKGWILSGHTHGGQCRPPFIHAPILPVENKNYDQGVKDLGDGRTLYINRALGHLYQVRFNVRPEITLFELTA